MNSMLVGLCFGLGFAIFYITTVKLLNRRGFRRYDLFSVPVGIAIFLICLMGGFMLSCFATAKVPMKTLESTVELAAMRGADGIAGSFVYGTGGISSAMVFRVFVKNDDGSLSPAQIYGNSYTRVIESSELHNTGTWRHIWQVEDETSPLNNWALISKRPRTVGDVLTVPVGTVVQNFKAN